MFHDLDATLRQLPRNVPVPAALPPLLPGAVLSFETPDKTFGPALQANTLNLFLFNVAENRALRDPRPIEARQGNVVSRRPAPIRLDCTYMVTAWATAVGQQKIADEHQLLAEAIGWLSGFPVIPPTFRVGSIAGQLYPPLLGVAQLDPTKDAGEFWLALGITPRPVIALTATITMDVAVATEIPTVTAVEAEYAPMGAR